MDETEFKDRVSAIWNKADEHVRMMYELTYFNEDDNTRKPMPYAGFGEAVLGLLDGLVDLYEEFGRVEKEANRHPSIQIRNFREFLHILKTRFEKR